MLFEKGEAYGHCVKLSLAVQSSAPSVMSKVTQQSRRGTKPDLPSLELSLPVCTGLQKALQQPQPARVAQQPLNGQHCWDV